ncbi:MAG: 50S ribosomal protein L35 [Kiritimatiellae bacterium]|jgi:large subunit ribosomal protein L35|nr:50S ribosomal protein L35 [Kiritimatiellia bacterium]
MPKMKTKKAVAKRFRKTASGKLRHKGAACGHLFTTKSPKRKRHARRGSTLHPSETKRLVHLI